MRGCRDWRLGLSRGLPTAALDGGVDQVGPGGLVGQVQQDPPPVELRIAPLPGLAAVDVLEPVMPLQSPRASPPAAWTTISSTVVGATSTCSVRWAMCCSHLSCPNGARTWSTCRAVAYGPTPKTVKRRLADHVWRRMLADDRRRETSSIPPMRSLEKHRGTSVSPKPSRLGSGHTRVRPPGRPTGGRERSTTGPSYTTSVSVRGPGPRARTGQRRGARVGAAGRTRCRQLAGGSRPHGRDGGRARAADRDRAAPLLRRGRRAAQPAGHGGAGCRRRRAGADGVPRRRGGGPGGGPGGGRRRVGAGPAQMGQVSWRQAASQNIHS